MRCENDVVRRAVEAEEDEEEQDLDGELTLKQVVQCLCAPQAYFSEILITSLRLDVDESAKDSVTRVIVTRADDDDTKLIKEEFQSKYGTTLAAKIEKVANGSLPFAFHLKSFAQFMYDFTVFISNEQTS
ncbi:hypothetical protein K7X08_009501 [Anisodus acutangulus]|uniref:Uncharacterized protein n=1 Tax=Anisodus acutangulus TaxID=402998 RepID=A0A9Q1RQW4_9SOLA|nr:hypothetical protein K7X08_009501 [Anisodus acutangulus]